jgi:hypothetical protein
MQAKKQKINKEIEVLAIEPKDIEEMWPLAEFQIIESLKYGGSWADASHIKENCKQNTNQLFIIYGSDDGLENKVFGVMVTQFMKVPNFKEYQVLILTGKHYKLWVDQVIKTIEAMGKLNGCKRISVQGRPGYLKSVIPHGWKVKHYHFVKELT